MEDEAEVKAELKIHEVVAKLQQLNGMRHSDYEAYRRFLTRRLRKVRKSINFTYGRGRNFVKKEITAENAQPAHLMILLLNTERAWAYAMQLKQTMNRGESENHLANHMLRRFTKAVKWSTALEQLSGNLADGRTCLEINAYASWMSANLYVEQEAWSKALENFTTAHRICEELGKVGSLEQQDLFTQRSEEITQSIRYCNYNMGSDKGEGGVAEAMADGGMQSSAELEAQLDAVTASTASAVDNKDMMEWRHHKIPIHDEDLRKQVVKAKEVDRNLDTTALEERKESQYFKVINAYDDALHTLSTKLDKLSEVSGGAKAEAMRRDLSLLTGALSYLKLSRMLERNKQLATGLRATWRAETLARAGGANARPEDIVHLYDAVGQIYQDMIKLTGVEDDDDLMDEFQAKMMLNRACRCFFLAETYSNNSRPSDALALYNHANNIAIAAADQLETLRPEDETEAKSVEQELEQVRELQSEAAGARSRVQAQAFLRSQDSKSNDETTVDDRVIIRSLQERIHIYDAPRDNDRDTLVVAAVPPAFRPVQCKPILFNKAHDHLTFPDLDVQAGVGEKERKGGLSGGFEDKAKNQQKVQNKPRKIE
eukprot:CAMPEP_0185745674 /NCGR_PEP_ID=MMETSP1174-20130828/4077_1 /TAXON_ID=35687 /ORGANISM="Dictyocha speculum, Strain CCMP1381" /LENGTH=599 /DNA_ID=CAMNT_0028419843 /DNA_START=22 /DNA_END=1822 /DNA_ORIENTATION=-